MKRGFAVLALQILFAITEIGGPSASGSFIPSSPLHRRKDNSL